MRQRWWGIWSQRAACSLSWRGIAVRGFHRSCSPSGNGAVQCAAIASTSNSPFTHAAGSATQCSTGRHSSANPTGVVDRVRKARNAHNRMIWAPPPARPPLRSPCRLCVPWEVISAGYPGGAYHPLRRADRGSLEALTARPDHIQAGECAQHPAGPTSWGRRRPATTSARRAGLSRPASRSRISKAVTTAGTSGCPPARRQYPVSADCPSGLRSAADGEPGRQTRGPVRRFMLGRRR